MKKLLVAASGILLASAFPSVSFAAETSPLSFNVSVTSDYRYRGISQTRLKPALQGGVDYAFANGFYVGTWASTIKWIKDSGANAGSTRVEVDVYGGYKGQISKDLSYDVGVLQYWYPSNHIKNITGENANTTELYGALTYGPATLKYSHSVTPLFGVPDSENSGYVDLSASFDVGAGVTIAPHVGYQRIAKNKSISYTDYSLTASKEFFGMAFSAAVVGTDTKDFKAPNGKNLGRTSLVVAVKKTF
jgi:uncharacterized protein (TIGR02001 family)